MYPEGWGKFSALLVFVGFNLTFFPQFILGYLGMPRRYHAYAPEFQVLNVLSTAGASILGVGYMIPLIYLPVVAEVWRAGRQQSLGREGTGMGPRQSPPTTFNFDVTPIVTEEAYAYAKHEEAHVG